MDSEEYFFSLLPGILIGLIIAILITILTIPSPSFPERQQDEYIKCVSVATTNNQPELLGKCKEILEVK